ncbi:hypothetical protein AAFF_G00277130 [Aldrovandia affinis]|uniref:GLTSCR protein conserved domain-containing protein n=1 Tax=Aldrovandia affinis TaxID=143900 RepID=A0AAD7W237_9TELE|nr:hypothetical protein AAFF_G00277130 [Aldrovandia affinis]
MKLFFKLIRPLDLGRQRVMAPAFVWLDFLLPLKSPVGGASERAGPLSPARLWVLYGARAGLCWRPRAACTAIVSVDMDDEDGRCLLDVICDPQALNDFLHGSETHLDTDDLLDGSADPTSAFFSGAGIHVPQVQPSSQLSVSEPAGLPSGTVDLDFLEDDDDDDILGGLAEANITAQSLQEAEAELDLGPFGLPGLTQVVQALPGPGLSAPGAGGVPLGVELGGQIFHSPVPSATPPNAAVDMMGSVLAQQGLQLQPQVMGKALSVQPFVQQALPNGSQAGHLGIGQIQVVGQPTVMAINQSGQQILAKTMSGYQLHQPGADTGGAAAQPGLSGSVLSPTGGLLIQGGKATLGSPALNGAGVGNDASKGAQQQGPVPVSAAQGVAFLTGKPGGGVVLSAQAGGGPQGAAFPQALFKPQVSHAGGKPLSVHLLNQSGSIVIPSQTVLQGQNHQFLLPQLQAGGQILTQHPGGHIITSQGPGGQILANQILTTNQNLNLGQVLAPQGHPGTAHILSGHIQLQPGQMGHPALFQMPVSLAQNQTHPGCPPTESVTLLDHPTPPPPPSILTLQTDPSGALAPPMAQLSPGKLFLAPQGSGMVQSQDSLQMFLQQDQKGQSERDPRPSGCVPASVIVSSVTGPAPLGSDSLSATAGPAQSPTHCHGPTHKAAVVHQIPCAGHQQQLQIQSASPSPGGLATRTTSDSPQPALPSPLILGQQIHSPHAATSQTPTWAWPAWAPPPPGPRPRPDPDPDAGAAADPPAGGGSATDAVGHRPALRSAETAAGETAPGPASHHPSGQAADHAPTPSSNQLSSPQDPPTAQAVTSSAPVQLASLLVKTPSTVSREVKVFSGGPGPAGATVTLGLAPSSLTQSAQTTVLKRPFSMEPSKEARMLEQLRKQQGSVLRPDYSSPFHSFQESAHRLLPYHLYQGTLSTPQDFCRVDEEFQSVSSQLLKRTQAMLDKYRHLLFEESKRMGPSAEMVMIDRMFIQEEKMGLSQDRVLARERPEEFVALSHSLESASQRPLAAEPGPTKAGGAL